MTLSSPSQIWKSSIAPRDLAEAKAYATISFPWTFDRMHYGSKTQRSSNDRLLHVLLGVLGQSILERELKKRGHSCKMDWTGYRDSDIFDFEINNRKYDVKTTVVYSEYNERNARELFTPELLIKHRDNRGPEWRNFFPVMVAMTQLTIDKLKDSYIFGIAMTEKDLRKRKPTQDDSGFWCASPFGKPFTFFANTYLIKAREAAGKGFFPKFAYIRNQSRIDDSASAVNIWIYGEWDGKQKKTLRLELRPGERVELDEEYSSIGCLRVEHPATLSSVDEIVVSAKNNFRSVVTTPTNPALNLNDQKFAWELGSESFVNLEIPDDYRIHWLGTIPFGMFTQRFVEYPSYFIPLPSRKDVNQPGRATKKFMDKLAALDRRREKALAKGVKIPWPEFSSLVSRGKVNAGIMMSARRPDGQVIGAQCHYYPTGYGFYESALYVLPKDLETMDSLARSGAGRGRN